MPRDSIDIMNESFDLLTGDHFHIILHPDRIHGLIFNRLDRTVTLIDYDDAKEFSNVKYVGRVYGIVGRFLDRHLVLIKDRSKVGSLHEPNSKTDHEVYVITQVQVIDLFNVTTSTIAGNSQPTTAYGKQPESSSVKYVATTDRDNTVGRQQQQKDGFLEMEMKSSDSFSSLPITINTNSYVSNQARSSNWNPFKLANSLRPMVPSQFLRSSHQHGQSSGKQQSTDSNQRNNNGESSQSSSVVPVEDVDKRLVDEMMKFFNNTNSFYFSPTLDLTNNFARKNLIKYKGNEPVWRAADERFFWNKYMLKDLIDLSRENSDANHFICVILQGYIAIHEQTIRTPSSNDFSILTSDDAGGKQATSMSCLNSSRTNINDDQNCDTNYSSIPNCNNDPKSSKDKFRPKRYRLALVSRRSVFQAGTRYRRRGCDEKGNCANFVETEQIFKSEQHFTSMLIIRGSIPLFWYQTGINYRPPPVLTKSEEENHKAFKEHFTDLIHQYETEQIIPVDCTEQSGREKALHDAYKRNVDKFKATHSKVKLIEFDYHKYCRGRQCTDAQIEKHLNTCGLTEQVLKDVKYYWNDGEVVLRQEGVFRVNCIDCTDRTNVVQRIIALQILDLQLARLGIIAPDASPEENQCKRVMQTMWSANGNVLSTQYCGTKALFGGDRKLAGYIKDTYSSASRYYISKFRDVYRQAAIDAMLGIESVEATNLEAGLKDQHELLSFDPMLAGQRGGAILRDVGSRVTNRLARLKGRFNVKPFGQLDTHLSGCGGLARFQQQRHINSGPDGIVETGLIETLGKMSIDWPSSEDIHHQTIEAGTEARQVQDEDQGDVFERYAVCDDNFQDDEFGQLMLSIDLAELQRLRDKEGPEHRGDGEARFNEHKDWKSPEEIDLKEAGGISNQATSGKQQEKQEDTQLTDITSA